MRNSLVKRMVGLKVPVQVDVYNLFIYVHKPGHIGVSQRLFQISQMLPFRSFEDCDCEDGFSPQVSLEGWEGFLHRNPTRNRKESCADGLKSSVFRPCLK